MIETPEGLEFLGYEVENLIGVYRYCHKAGTRQYTKVIRKCLWSTPEKGICNYEITRQSKVKGHLNTHQYKWTSTILLHFKNAYQADHLYLVD